MPRSAAPGTVAMAAFAVLGQLLERREIVP